MEVEITSENLDFPIFQGWEFEPIWDEMLTELQDFDFEISGVEIDIPDFEIEVPETDFSPIDFSIEIELLDTVLGAIP